MDILTSRRIWLAILLFAVVFQWVSRYAGAPVVDFVVDDWRLWKIAQDCDSLGEALLQARNWPDRPLGTSMMIGTFYLLGDRIVGYVVLESLYTALFLLAGMWTVWVLTRDRLTALLFGLVLALWPNLTESFQWHTMTASYGLGFAAYLVVLGAWAHYLRGRGAFWLAVAVGAFAFALFTYEAGIALPAAFLLLGDRENRRRLAAGLAVFAVVVGLYLIWKFTDGLGTVENRLFPFRRVSPDWAGIAWNMKEMVRWWAGARLLECFANGLDGFLTLSSRGIRWLLVLNVALVAAAMALVRRMCVAVAEEEPAPFGVVRLALVGAAWWAAANVLTALSWTGGRMNYLPAFGASLLVVLVARRLLKNNGLSCGAALVMLLCLIANQGTSAQWRDSGRFHRAMYDHLRDTAAEWSQAPIVLFDTTRIRERTTRRAVGPASRNWGAYGNSVLMRGAFFKSMMELVVSGHGVKTVLLDMEHGAYVEGAELHWHNWYDSSQWHTADIAKVYMVDCLEVGVSQP
ncbi:MAG: hypothetical protein EOM10_09935 [Opitutae bacterium]|nr:hypothetical protein [Opitutae bacterium]